MGIIRAIRLLGSEAIITGIRPGVAQIIVELGIDLSAFVTKRTLRAALMTSSESVNKPRKAKPQPR
jgi:rsbT co-antagonist protein RsbR